MGCIFSFVLSAAEVNVLHLSVRRTFGGYIMQTDPSTPYSSFCKGDRECAVFGIAADLETGESEDLPEKMLSYGDDIRLVNLTLADGSAFESIDVVKVSEIKAVLENINRYDKTYGHLVFKMDFETGKTTSILGRLEVLQRLWTK